MDVVEKLTRAVSSREEPRMWEYYRMENTLYAVATVALLAVVILIGVLVL